jgi:S1-C subfamily serine protease
MSRTVASRLLAPWLAFLACLAWLIPASAMAQVSVGRVNASLVVVGAYLPDGTSRGTGFIVAPGIVVTNYHVVEGAERLVVIPNGRNGTAQIDAVLITSSAREDLAVLRVSGLSGAGLQLAATEPEQGKSVWAFGFPASAERFDVEPEFTSSVTIGAVSRVLAGASIIGRQLGSTRMVQHDATIAPGSSGGPLVDACTRVVGVNTQVGGDRGASFYYAVSSSEVIALLRTAGVTPRTVSGQCGGSSVSPESPDDPVAPGAAAPVPGTAPNAGISGGTPAGPSDTASGQPPKAQSQGGVPRRVQPGGPRDLRNELAIARQRENAARNAAAAARRAADNAAANQQQQAETAARRQVEAQMAIAEETGRRARELEKLVANTRTESSQRSALERFGPLGLALAGLALLGAAIAVAMRIKKAAAARTLAKQGELQEAERTLEARRATLARTDGEVILRGEDRVLRLPRDQLDRGLIVGRSAQSCDVIVKDPSVSRKQAKITRLPDGSHVIEDMGSSNGTLLDGRQLVPGVAVPVGPGAEIVFGRHLPFRWE